jgi:hypothetical protein
VLGCHRCKPSQAILKVLYMGSASRWREFAVQKPCERLEGGSINTSLCSRNEASTSHRFTSECTKIAVEGLHGLRPFLKSDKKNTVDNERLFTF